MSSEMENRVGHKETDVAENPTFPFESTVGAVFRDLAGMTVRPTSIGKEYYLRIAEHIARLAITWQGEDGVVVNPVIGRETATITARFAGLLGQLIAAGRCEDLVEQCALATDVCCEGLSKGENPSGGPIRGAEFYAKEIMFAYNALESRVAPQRVERWGELLRSFDPWHRYESCQEQREHNYCIYAICGEQFKTQAGITDSTDFIDRVLDNQMKLINEYGLYRDPYDPMTYDLTSRQQLLMMLNHGYCGRHAESLREKLNRGSLTQLLCQSTTGQAPFGGRSNQYHIMEGMGCCICEMQAKYYADKDQVKASAFKRAARKYALSVNDWILCEGDTYSIKNRFPSEHRHGDESYDSSPSSCYLLLAGGLFATAAGYADETIPEGPCPIDRGGYSIHMFPAFHRTFATCGEYHIEIDTRGQGAKDAIGLGRIHRCGVRPETALSVTIPAYASVHFSEKASDVGYTIGPAWKWGTKNIPLANFINRIFDVDYESLEQSSQQVAFSLTYRGDIPGVDTVKETYRLTPEGLTTEYSCTGGTLTELIVPLIETDGLAKSQIELLDNGFLVRYEQAEYRITAESMHSLSLSLSEQSYPNISGLYRLARFHGPIDKTKFHFILQRRQHDS